MIRTAQPAAAPEVSRAALVEPEHDIDAPAAQLGDHPVRAEEGDFSVISTDAGGSSKLFWA
jgi:hypothetical protein